MRILFLDQFSELGGGQRCLLDLLPAIRERGWSALVAAPGSGPLLEQAAAAGADTARIEMGTYHSGSKTAGDAGSFIIDTMRLEKWIAKQAADIVFVSAPRPLIAAAMGARGRPVIFHALHCIGKRYAISALGWAIRRARAHVIAVAACVGAPYARHLSPERLHVVYNGVREIPFATRKFGHEGPWRIGMIGRIAPMKGQTDFLRAAALVSASLPRARFAICGAPMFSPKAYVEEVHRLAAGLPVEFLGWREDVGAVLGDLDLLVLPSTAAEATPRVILEAFSAGVPVVGYAIGGIPEIVRDFKNGFLVPECNPHALAQKILEVTALDLRPVATQARADWERNYTVEHYREQIAGIIAGCAATT